MSSSLDDLVNQLLGEHQTKKLQQSTLQAPAAPQGMPASAGAVAEGSMEQLIKAAGATTSVTGGTTQSPGVTPQPQSFEPQAGSAPADSGEAEQLRMQITQLQTGLAALRAQNQELIKKNAATPAPAPATSDTASAGGAAIAGATFPWRRHLSLVEDSLRKKDVVIAEPLIKVMVDVSDVITAEPAIRIRLMTQLGTIHLERSKYADAEEILNKAMVLVQGLEGAGTNEVLAKAFCLDALAQCHQEREDFETAEKLRREAVKLAEESLGQEHPDAGYFHERLDKMRQQRQIAMIGKDEGSKTVLDKLTAEFNAGVGAGAPEGAEEEKPADAYAGMMFEKYFGMGKTYLMQKNVREAESSLRSAMEKAAGVPNKDPRKSEAMGLLAHLIALSGKENEAKEMYEGAVTLAFKHVGWNNEQMATWLTSLADLHAKLNDVGLAKNYFQQAMNIYSSVLGPEHETTVLAQQKYTEFLDRMKTENQWKGWSN